VSAVTRGRVTECFKVLIVLGTSFVERRRFYYRPRQPTIVIAWLSTGRAAVHPAFSTVSTFSGLFSDRTAEAAGGAWTRIRARACLTGA
jgi:hypothetical protein